MKSDIQKIVDVVIPIHTEDIADIKRSIQSVDEYLSELSKKLQFSYKITIACSASPESTVKIVQKMTRHSNRMRFVQEELPGRGRVLKNAWNSSKSDIVMYMDVDLATSLDSLEGLLMPLLRGFKGIVIGNRRLKASQTSRSWLRRALSATYYVASRMFTGSKVTDMQCGFKAMPTTLAKKLIPRTSNDAWLFDSELIHVAVEQNIKVTSVPVVWNESAKTTAKFGKLSVESMRFIDRVAKQQKRLVTPERVLICTIVLFSFLLYFGSLSTNGWANVYYSAATQAATKSWKAFLFGSFDSLNFVSIDKFPIAIWPSVLSVKIFGFSQFAVLLPHALTGVAISYLLYKIVRKRFGVVSATIASVLFVASPLSVLMFRFNNPDTYLTLCGVLVAYIATRALERNTWKWYVAGGVVLGLAFQLKTLQSLIFVVPVIVLWLWELRVHHVPRLVKNLALGLLSFLATALWWPIMASFVPFASRPIIGGSATNNVWDLIFGYNGISRLTGVGSAKVSGQTTAVFGGGAGPLRLFNNSFFSNIGWFLLPALVVAVYAIWYCWYYNNKVNRKTKSQLLFWSVYLLAHVVIFSITRGKMHAYYSLSIVPALGALIGISWWLIRDSTDNNHGKLLYWLAGSVLVSIAAIMPNMLRSIDTSWNAWLFWPLLVGGSLLVVAYIFLAFNQKLGAIKLLYSVGLVIIFGASLFSTTSTYRQSYVGYVPTATPKDSFFDQVPALPRPDSKLFQRLASQTNSNDWIAATENSFDASIVELSTGRPVMALGGFDGRESIVSQRQLEKYIQQKKITYFLTSDPNPQHAPSNITKWVAKNSHRCNISGQWGLYAFSGNSCPDVK